MIIATGRSNVHVRAIADRVAARPRGGFPAPRIEGVPHGDWVLIDADDAIVHIFKPDVRQFYNLEKLWAPTDPATIGTPGRAEPIAPDADRGRRLKAGPERELLARYVERVAELADSIAFPASTGVRSRGPRRPCRRSTRRGGAAILAAVPKAHGSPCWTSAAPR